MCTTLETIVIVDTLELLDAATVAAQAARPDHHLQYSIYGIASCQTMPDGRHVHWFSDDVQIMRSGIEKRKKFESFGGFLYVTATPDAPHVQRHCDGLASIVPDARPVVLALA